MIKHKEEIKWPPRKAWTSKKIVLGYRHFVAINYGGVAEERWVLLIAVLNGHSNLKESWKRLINNDYWDQGWIELRRSESNPSTNNFKTTQYKKLNEKSIIASQDSGLLIPNQSEKVRDW